MTERKSPDDVRQLLKGKQLGDLQYREFTAPQAAHLTLAGSKAAAPDPGIPPASALSLPELPKAALPEQAVAPRKGPIAGLPSAPAVGATLAPTAPLSRGTVHESPLNFTFERLRRQVIPARANGPLIDLNLKPRQRAVLPSRVEKLQQRTLSEVFNTLVQKPGAQRRGV